MTDKTTRAMDAIGRALRAPGELDPATMEALAAALDVLEETAVRRREMAAEGLADRQLAELSALWQRHVAGRPGGPIDSKAFWAERRQLLRSHRAERRALG